MKLYSVYGKPVSRTVTRFLIKWDGNSRSKLQFRVKQLLKQIWFSDVVFEEFPVFGSKLRLDFYNGNKRVAVEVNGPQHEKFNAFFHNNSPDMFIHSIKRDLTKHAWCEKNDIYLVEIEEKDLVNLSLFYRKIQNANT